MRFVCYSLDNNGNPYDSTGVISFSISSLAHSYAKGITTILPVPSIGLEVFVLDTELKRGWKYGSGTIVQEWTW